MFVEFTSENASRKIVLTIFQVILFGFPRENRKGVSCTHSDVWRFPIWFPRRKILCILCTGWLNKRTGSLWWSFSWNFPLLKGQFGCGHVVLPMWWPETCTSYNHHTNQQLLKVLVKTKATICYAISVFYLVICSKKSGKIGSVRMKSSNLQSRLQCK